MGSTTYGCDVITLKEGHAPYRGFFNLLIPNYITHSRINETSWYSQFQPDETKEIVDYISKRVYVLSSFEKSLNLFILSTGFRCFTILCSSLKLAVDKSSLKPVTKKILTATISLLPGLALYYFMDYSVRDYIIGELLTEAISVASSAFSYKWGNYFRRLDLISDDKNFSLAKYLLKSSIGISCNSIITLLAYGVQSFAYPHHEMVSENVIRYCVEIDKRNLSSVADKIVIWAHKSKTMISLREKAMFFAGKFLVDAIVIASNYFGKQEDLRSPFINAFKKTEAEIRREELLKSQREAEQKRLQKQQKKKENKSKGRDVELETADIKPVPVELKISDYQSSAVATLTHRKEKERKESKPKSEVIASSSNSLGQEIEIGGRVFYPIHSDQLPKNTWAVLSLKKSFGNESEFENCLKRNAMESSSSRVVYDRVRREFKIKPKTTGQRVLGSIHHGSSGFDRLFDLANSISAQERLRDEANGVEPSLIIFDQRRKHEDVYKR